MLVLAVGANTYQGLMEEKMREVCVNVAGREEEGGMRLRCGGESERKPVEGRVRDVGGWAHQS